MSTETTPAVALSWVIENLRTVKTAGRKTITAAHVRTVIDDVRDCVPLFDTARRAELSAFSEAEIRSIAEDFGKYRARVWKERLEKSTSIITSDQSGMLLPYSIDEKARLAAAFADLLDRGKPLPKKYRMVLPDLLAPDCAVLPRGYDKEASGRDIGRSLSAIMMKPVDDGEIIRFVERTYTVPGTTLSADHVQLLHWVAAHGLSAKLLELAGKRVGWMKSSALSSAGPVAIEVKDLGVNSVLCSVLVQAYDLLEVARADAVTALGVIVRTPDPMTTVDVDTLRGAIANARWLAAGELNRLDKLAAQVQQDPRNARLAEILRARVHSFSLAVRHNPLGYAVGSVEQLNQGHLLQILAANGLGADAAEEKAVLADVRARLTGMGLLNDLDRELPAGLRAWRSGRLEEFYSTRQARADGDPAWMTIYVAESESVDAVVSV